MKLVLAILFFVFQVDHASAGEIMAEASLWMQNKFSTKSCEEVSVSDLTNLKSRFASCGSANDILLSGRGSASDIAENMLFNSLATKQLEQTECKITSVGFFKQNPELIKFQAQLIEDKLPLIKDQITAANLAYAEFTHVSTKAAMMAGYFRNMQGAARQETIKEWEKLKLEAEALEKKWKEHKTSVHTAIGSFWNGNTKSIEKMIFNFTKAQVPPSRDEIETTLFNTIDLVKQEFIDSKVELLKQSESKDGVRIFNDLSDSYKAQLLEGVTTSKEFSSAVNAKDDSMLRVMCRAEGRYTKGREKLTTALTVGSFALGGFGGLLSKIPLAVRAGRLGQVLNGARSSSVVIGAMAGGLDISVMAESLYRSCIQAKASYNIQNSCPADKVQAEKAELERIEQDNCLFEAVISALPAGAVAGTMAYKKLAPKLKSSSQAAREKLFGKKIPEVVPTEAELAASINTGAFKNRPKGGAGEVERRGDASNSSKRRESDAKAKALEENERRSFHARTLKGPEGKVLGVHMAPTIPKIPNDTRILKVRTPEGKEVLYYEIAERLPSGEWVKRSREIQMDNVDSLTKLGRNPKAMPEKIQALDARFVGGRELFDHMVKAKAGKAHVAFIDVGSLGKVNKDFASGTVGGDRYLRSVRESIMRHSEGKITLARLGGDEFGLIIDEASSAKVQQMLAKIQKDIRSDFASDAKAVFREEKIRLAQEYRDAKASALAKGEKFDHETAIAKIDEIARTASPDVSIGAAQIGSGDSVENLMEAAERQAKEMKIATVLEHGRSAEKYRNFEDPNKVPKPLYISPVAEPVSSLTWSTPGISLEIPHSGTMRNIKVKRVEEVGRFDDMSIAIYKDEAERAMYRIEKYMTDPATGKRSLASYEIPTRGQTGMWDGMHEVSQSLVMSHVRQNPENLLVMPKLKSLRYLNYFASGTKAGDEILEELSKIIKKNTRLPSLKDKTNGDLAFKLNGADFLISFEKMNPAEVAKLEKRVNEELARSDVLKRLKIREEAELKERLAIARKNGNKKEIAAYEKDLKALPNFVPDVRFESMRPSEIGSSTFEQVLERFDQAFKTKEKAP